MSTHVRDHFSMQPVAFSRLKELILAILYEYIKVWIKYKKKILFSNYLTLYKLKMCAHTLMLYSANYWIFEQYV